VEYPTTRAPQASPAERAADIHAAFADPEIKAVIASIGGDDQLKVLGHLDPSLLAAHPKPFFGYSDNTNLHLFLWNLGLVSYLGGSVMVQFGWPVAMHAFGRRSLEERRDAQAKARYTREQHEAVVAAVAEYHPGVPLVFGVDFGHTEPQFVIPSGGTVTVDGASREIYVTY
jgi:muramoyltetrapeptide carboxypeptidase LdcA involved in peptidoglycan recycling